MSCGGVSMDIRGIFFAALFVALAGCASTPPLGADNGSRPVRIDPAVATPAEMYYLGPSAGTAAGMLVGGLIGGAIVASANIEPGKELDQLAKDHGIYIDQIVKQEATAAFQQSGKLKLVDASGASDTILKIDVTQYGFTIPTGFSTDVVPIVAIKCTLTDSSGKVIWSANDRTLA